MSDSSACQIFARFETAGDFERIIQGSGQDRGLLLPLAQGCAVGRKASVWISVMEYQATGNLSGTITWRRIRSGGKALPQGQFVSLESGELDHLDRLVGYLKRAPEGHSRRHHERYPFVTRATLSAFNQSYTATTRNISKRGTQIVLSGPKLLAGQDIKIQLQLSHAIGALVDLQSVVAWSETNDLTTSAGIAFSRNETELARLASEIARVKRALSRRWVTR